MYGNTFYNETTRKYVATFGTHFNDIIINRKDNAGTTIQTFKVPINYAPMQKILAKLEQDPSLNAPAMTLPRMSFEITNMAYNPSRKLGSLTRLTRGIPGTNDSLLAQYVPAPYDIEFQLNIMTKYDEDGTKILEQIIPYFKPEVTPSVQLIADLDPVDVPIVLNSVSKEDVYEGAFEERRALIWTLSFTMKAYYFGPTTTKKIIKFVEANVYIPLTADDPFERITVQPGLTANGEPTTDQAETIAYQDINFDDDWAYIVTIEDL